MRKSVIVAAAAVAAGAAALSLAQPRGGPPWRHWRSMGPWRMGPGMGPGMMGGSQRRREAMMSGVPAPYASMANPLPHTAATIERGRAVYADNCASCHGKTGRGDGPSAKDLSPPPANLAWLSSLPMVDWDGYMLWTVEEGGAAFKTAMPAFKDVLSKDDSWAAIAYIQAQLPPAGK